MVLGVPPKTQPVSMLMVRFSPSGFAHIGLDMHRIDALLVRVDLKYLVQFASKIIKYQLVHNMFDTNLSP